MSRETLKAKIIEVLNDSLNLSQSCIDRILVRSRYLYMTLAISLLDCMIPPQETDGACVCIPFRDRNASGSDTLMNERESL